MSNPKTGIEEMSATEVDRTMIPGFIFASPGGLVRFSKFDGKYLKD
ncbi:MAG: hypothetical protein ACJAVI_003672 [Candidatus Azotimanducaceae bacterium]|jgi:hypothetical protein